MAPRRTVPAALQPYEHLLGRVPDRVIAERAGVPALEVTRARRELRISGLGTRTTADGVPYKVTSRRRGRPSRIAPFADLVGEVPDEEVAALAGVGPRAIKIYRAKNGISAPKSARGPGRPSTIAPFAHLLGTMPDARVAEIAGATPGAVGLFRRKRGIPVYRKQLVWKVVIEDDGEELSFVLVAADVVAAMGQVAEGLERRPGARFQSLDLVGEALLAR